MSETIEPGTALAILPRASLPTILAADDKDILGSLLKELEGWEPDVSTEKGRREIASKAQKVRVAKADFERLADGLKESAIKTQRAVNAELKILEARMKELVDRVRAPLNEYEAREKRRVEGHEAALKEIEAVFITLPAGVAPDEIRERVAQVENWPLRDWEEFRARAERETNVTLGLLHRALGAAAKREEDEREAEAEAERQRLAAIEAQRQREEQIAADAAEQARIAAEERAAREAREAQERADTALREAEARARAERDAAARALADATERERVAEEQRVAGHRAALDNLAALANDWPEGLGLQGMEIRLAHANQMVTRDWQEFAMQAAAVHADAVRLIEGHIAIERENIRVANEIAEETRVENERKRAEAEAAEAVEAERLRVAREKATQQAEDDRRAANKAHRARINNMVMAGLVALGGCIDEDVAKKIIIAVAKGEVHHMRIDYAADVKAGALL